MNLSDMTNEDIGLYCDIVNNTNNTRQAPPEDSSSVFDTRTNGLNYDQMNYCNEQDIDSNCQQQSSSSSSSAANLNKLLEELKSDNTANRTSTTTNGANANVTMDCSHRVVKSTTTRKKKKEVYKFETDWLISNVCWSNDDDGHENNKLALTSFIEEYKNFVQVVQLAKDEPDQELESVLTFEHPYPATRIQWTPKRLDNTPQLLATTADYLRLWRVNLESSSSNYTNGDGNNSRTSTGHQNEAKLECLLNSNQGSKLCAPLTSFDWCSDASSIVTSSVDTTCAIWDIDTSTLVNKINASGQRDSITASGGSIRISLRTQLVAHDHHVYDVAWSPQNTGKDIIVTSSADGSVRLFDLRKLSTSSVLYDTSKAPSGRLPLVRVSCSKMDSYLVGTFALDSSELIILDTRKPGQALCVLSKHLDSINSISWSPQSAKCLCSGSSDNQALIWQICDQPNPSLSYNNNNNNNGNNRSNQEQKSTQINRGEPQLAYRASGKINSTSWAPSNTWVAIGYRNCLELLRV